MAQPRFHAHTLSRLVHFLKILGRPLFSLFFNTTSLKRKGRRPNRMLLGAMKTPIGKKAANMRVDSYNLTGLFFLLWIACWSRRTAGAEEDGLARLVELVEGVRPGGRIDRFSVSPLLLSLSLCVSLNILTPCVLARPESTQDLALSLSHSVYTPTLNMHTIEHGGVGSCSCSSRKFHCLLNHRRRRTTTYL